MKLNWNQAAFCLFLIVVIMSCYSFYSTTNQTWSVSPPVFILCILTAAVLLMGIIGYSKRSTRHSKIRGGICIFLYGVMTALLFFGSVVHMVVREPLKTTTSPDKGYEIHLYTVNGGAAGSISVEGVLDGPLWFKKVVYRDRNRQQAKVEWTGEGKVLINDILIDLTNDEVFSDL